MTKLDLNPVSIYSHSTVKHGLTPIPRSTVHSKFGSDPTFYDPEYFKSQTCD